MSEFSVRSLEAIQEALSAGRLTVKQVVEGYLQKIREYAHLNAFNEVYEDEAIEAAGKVDERLREGKAGEFAGLVVGLKDNICYREHRVSASSKILQDFEPPYNATVVDRLIEADAVIIGRLNCDEFGMGSTNENSAYGAVLNPLDEGRVPGGSSGGAAVAVKAGMCTAALGSDTGGSIRQPAAFCDVIGLKPTYGRVSRYGLIAYASSFDQIGPITNNVADSARILELIAGKDSYDNTASDKKVPSYSKSPLQEKKKVAYFKDVLERKGVDPGVRERTEEVLETLEKEGHAVEAVDFPLLDHVVPTYQVLSNAEASSNLARYDGVHYGFRASGANDLKETYELTRTQGFGKEVKRRIMLGTFVLSSGYYEAYYGQAQKVRRSIRDHTENLLTEHDHLLLPTTPKPPFRQGEFQGDPVNMYLQDIFTVPANLAGIPAISIPAGKNEEGLPIGIQVMSAPFNEEGLLAFSADLENKISASTARIE